VVNIVTRTNPDTTLEKIVTTLSKFYLPPVSLPPLDNDEEGNGKPSDHFIIVWRPIRQLEDYKPKQKNIVKGESKKTSLSEIWFSLYLESRSSDLQILRQ
jgi:hypothetical protein